MGIKIFTDLPIPFTTPAPTIKQVIIKNKECQKIKFKGDEDSLKKCAEEYEEGFSKPEGKRLKTYEKAIPAKTL
tara:strand:+ start:534 stop:755 length:222 start_codon:yes stop_codon:yes gene_type:complete